jgi:hypothetical protein
LLATRPDLRRVRRILIFTSSPDDETTRRWHDPALSSLASAARPRLPVRLARRERQDVQPQAGETIRRGAGV